MRNHAIIESLEPRRLFDVTVLVGDASGFTSDVVKYLDADGTRGRISVLNGGASITLAGTSLTSHIGSGGQILIEGIVQSVSNIDITNSSSITRFGMRSRGGGNDRLAAASVNADAAIGSFKAADTDFSGDIDIQGLDTFVVRTLGGDATFGSDAASGVVSIIMRSARGASLTCGNPISKLQVRKWVAGDPAAAMTITAPKIKELFSDGDFQADLLLSGAAGNTLGEAQIGGDVIAESWQVTGNVGATHADRFADNFVYAVSGHVERIYSRRSTGGRFGFGSLDRFNVDGDLINARISLLDDFVAGRQNLDKLDVEGEIIGVNLFSDGSIDKVVAGALRDSNIFAGVDFDNDAIDAAATGTLPDPDTAGDIFLSPATINSIRLKLQNSITFSNTRVLGYHIDRMRLGDRIEVDNGGVPFGVVARDVQLVSGTTSDNKPLFVRDIPVLGSFLTQANAQGTDPKDLLVLITPQIIAE